MLSVEDINIYYGNIHSVKNVSFTVEEGNIVSLIGANGAGKSTILKTISGIMRSKSGKILFKNENIENTEPYKIVRNGLSHVPEGRRVFLGQSVYENLEMGHYTQPKSTFKERLEFVYTKFPRLKERRKQPAGTLSGGEQQMLAIGRALMVMPKLLMLDEPSMGLAPMLIHQIFDIIKDLNKKGITILLVEQNAKMALNISNKAYVLETGKIISSGDSKSLLQDNIIKTAYLGG
ncbi:MAG: ABC transporter ATP-binding protein [Defluviitaleaceae bacterium]|nr:ABC transporter ATP-binding protein [Defluviitaleaceae bacterium]